jgi:exodeoxyribonuclease-3
VAFRRHLVFRIDHFLVTPYLVARCPDVTLERELRRIPQPSDHIPLLATWRDEGVTGLDTGCAVA